MKKKKKKTEANAVAGPHQRKKTQTQLITAFLSNVSENLTAHFVVSRARSFTLRVKFV